jgi:hypothetical protein
MDFLGLHYLDLSFASGVIGEVPASPRHE